MLPVFLDTCVLLRPYLCDTLLSVAEAGVYRPLWSPMVMTELERNLGRRGLNEKQIRHRLDQMNGACRFDLVAIVLAEPTARPT